MPLLVGIDMATFNKGDFQYALVGNMKFRKFVIYVMENEDIGTYRNKNFEWQVDIDVDQKLDIKNVLLTAPEITPTDNNMFNFDDEDRMNLMIAYHALLDYFPMSSMRVWLARNREFVLDGASDGAYRFLTISVSLLMLGIGTSMFLYVSLVL